ncbi:MAG: hypothetical protein ABI876_13495, partial [Bacteroidota bacterium]
RCNARARFFTNEYSEKGIREHSFANSFFEKSLLKIRNRRFFFARIARAFFRAQLCSGQKKASPFPARPQSPRDIAIRTISDYFVSM